jgi:Neurotransmitter-gated ion-channel ligand binding domain
MFDFFAFFCEHAICLFNSTKTYVNKHVNCIGMTSDWRQVDVDDYVDSNEWKLVSYPAKKHVKFYPCCKEPFPDLTFTIQVKRIAAFYSFILVLPCVLLSLLTLVSFWLPPESPAKVLLGTFFFSINPNLLLNQ